MKTWHRDVHTQGLPSDWPIDIEMAFRRNMLFIKKEYNKWGTNTNRVGVRQFPDTPDTLHPFTYRCNIL